MTGINIIRHAGAVHVLTDGQTSRDHNGEMSGLVAKVWSMPHLNAAMACAGILYHAPLLITDLGMSATTYDGLKAGIVDTAALAAARHRELFSRFAYDTFLLVVAGISETTGPSAFLFTNDTRLGGPLMQPIETGSVFTTPGDAEIQRAFRAEVFKGRTRADDIDPEIDGVAMLDIQRRNPSYGVGGFAQLTTITADGITTRILHRWSDAPVMETSDAAAA